MNPYLQRLFAGTPAGLDAIDMHGHLGIFAFAIPDYCTDVLVRGMDRMGIRSVVVSTMRAMSADCQAGNAEVLEAMREYPDRILGYVTVFPDDSAEARRSVEHWAGEGFVGLKLHNHNGYAYDHPAWQAACEVAAERRMPTLLHTWGQKKEFEEIRRLAERFAELPLLLAHSGAINEPEYVRIASEFPNIYLDTSYSNVTIGLIRRLAEQVGTDRIVWGSDVYFFSQPQQYGAILGSGLDEQALRTILEETPRKLLDAVQR